MPRAEFIISTGMREGKHFEWVRDAWEDTERPCYQGRRANLVGVRRDKCRVLVFKKDGPFSARQAASLSDPKVVVVIPSRYGSTRLPGKPLVSLAGKPMVQHVYERAKRAQTVHRVLVATDDQRIVDVVNGFGGEARMTRADHRTGTERTAEVAAHEPGDVFVNVQGDEPLIDPVAIDSAVAALLEEPVAQIATVATSIRHAGEIMDPNVVKTVLDFDSNGLYFSRAPIPWVRDTQQKIHVKYWKHLGLYVFQRDALLEYPTLPQGELEKIEQLEQLRWLENGWKIRVAEVEHDAVSVDVPEDVARVEKLLKTV